MPFAMIPILWVRRIVIVTFLPSVSPVLPVVASPGAGEKMRRIFAVERLGLLHVNLVLEMNLKLVRLLLQDLLKISSSLGSIVSWSCTYFYVQNCHNTSGWVLLEELNPNNNFLGQQTRSVFCRFYDTNIQY